MKLKNGKLSKGKRTKAKQLKQLKLLREDNIKKTFSKLGDKSANNRAMYKIANKFKSHLIKSNDSKTISPPKRRYTARYKKEYVNGYTVNKDTHQIVAKPKEWFRLTYKDINNVKIITKRKYI